MRCAISLSISERVSELDMCRCCRYTVTAGSVVESGVRDGRPFRAHIYICMWYAGTYPGYPCTAGSGGICIVRCVPACAAGSGGICIVRCVSAYAAGGRGHAMCIVPFPALPLVPSQCEHLFCRGFSLPAAVLNWDIYTKRCTPADVV